MPYPASTYAKGWVTSNDVELRWAKQETVLDPSTYFIAEEVSNDACLDTIA